MSQEAETQEIKRTLRKERVGVVVSDKMDSTIIVAVVRRVPHPKFRKIIKRTTKLYAHDEKGEAKAGDKVRVAEIKPMSKNKRWRLIEILAH
ncbi:MAG: 30S ribosomal protein S17 [Verrucomicrobiaceae bacterium]|nr:30S ribosomal protein S17 [Verrucomicrobiaceae bacterium]